jgi:hypothetical protein
LANPTQESPLPGISEKYNEAQLRQEFVNPLFRELGWDVDNRQGQHFGQGHGRPYDVRDHDVNDRFPAG